MTTENGTETPEEEAQEPTVEERLKVTEDALKAEQAKNTNLESSYKGLQTTVNRKDEEIKRAGDLTSRLDGHDETLRVLAAMVAEGVSRGEDDLGDETPRKKTDYLKAFDDISTRQKQQAQETEKTRKQDEYNQSALAIWNRAQDLGLKEEDDDYWIVYDALSRDGNLRKAEAKVAKLESTKGKEKPKEGDVSEEKDVEAKARDILENKGLLDQGGEIDGSSVKAWSDFEKAYVQGRISKEDYQKRALKEGKL